MYFACFVSFGDSNPRTSSFDLSHILKFNIVLAESILCKYRIGSFLLAIVLIFLIRTVAFFICKKFERNDFKCILPTHPNSGSLKGRCGRNLILTGVMMIAMKIIRHISLTSKMSIQTEKKTEVDFMIIKIRSPT